MESNNKIGFMEALSILMIVVFAHLILLLPKIIIENQGTGSIVNIIFVTLLALFAVYILNILYKKFKGMDILDISGFLFGKKFKFIVGLIYIIHAIFVASLLLRNTAENLKTTYFQNTPTPYIAFFMLVGVAYLCRFNLKTIIKCNLIIVPLIAVSFIALFILSSKNFVFERVFPILGYGAETTFLKGSANIFCFGNIFFLLLLMPYLKDYNQFNKLSYTSVILSGFFILITILGILLVFPLNVASTSNIPLYMQTRTLTFGKLLQRLDALFILIWDLNILSYLSIVIGFVVSIFKKITNIQTGKTISYTFVAILLGASLIYRNIIETRLLDSNWYKNFTLILVFGMGFLILLLANFKKLRQEKKSINKGEKQIE